MDRPDGSALSLPRLDAARIRELWSKTYNTAGKPDWSHIFPYYDEEIVFHDSIQRIEGKREFTAMCNRLTRRCKEISMDIGPVAEAADGFFFQWKMVTVFKNSPSTPVYGCTKLTVDAEGLISMQRDYYDLWGDIFNGIPGFRRLYRNFMRRFFG